ncbi:hypothetical protein [Paenarthrobacter sp. C1]|uniref:hypothetical protein n=1 Tax=Paenarthrobacter sp. C1 TaxID=3400220 RepID=UPI003BF46D25
MTTPPAPHALTPPTGAGARGRRDDGIVMLDVLVGLVVLAILLLTVITSVGPHRQRSYQANAISDARQLGGRIEAVLSDSSTLTAAGMPASEDALTDSLLATLGVNLTRGIAVARYTPLSGTQFQVCLVHYSGSTVDAYALYDSTRGRVTSSGRGAGPAACAPAPGAPDPDTHRQPVPDQRPRSPHPHRPQPQHPTRIVTRHTDRPAGQLRPRRGQGCRQLGRCLRCRRLRPLPRRRHHAGLDRNDPGRRPHRPRDRSALGDRHRTCGR